jgi:hypothetical protein
MYEIRKRDMSYNGIGGRRVLGYAENSRAGSRLPCKYMTVPGMGEGIG